MTMIQGITVQLNECKKSGQDEFGHSTYADDWVEVENVLVAPASTTEILETMNLTGKKAVYNLAIPKGDSHVWQDHLVKFFDSTWRVIGFPQEGIEANIPLDWNQKWQVERYG